MADADSEVVTLLSVPRTEGLEGAGHGQSGTRTLQAGVGAAEAASQDTRVCRDRERLVCCLEENVQVKLLVSSILCPMFSERQKAK